MLVLLLPPIYAKPQPRVEWTLKTSDDVTGVAISPDGNYVAAVSKDGYVYMANHTGDTVWKVKLDYPALSVAISSKGEFVAAGDEFMVHLFNKTGGRLWDEGRLIGDYVRGIAISARGERIAAGSANRMVYLFNNSGHKKWRYNTDSAVQGVGISSNGEYVAAGTSIGNIYLIKDGELVWQGSIGRFVTDMALSGQKALIGSRFVIAMADGDAAWKYYPNYEVLGIGVSWAEGKVAVGTEDGTVYVLDKDGKDIWKYKADASVADAAISDDEKIAIGFGRKVLLISPPDQTPPEVRISSPENNSKISGVVSINATINEELDILQVLIDNNFACASLPCNWDTSASPTGKHIITVRGVDKSENVGEESVVVTVARVKLPSVEEVQKKIENITETPFVEELQEKIANITEKVNISIGENYSEVLLPVIKKKRRIEFEYSLLWVLAAVLIVGIYLKIKTRKKGKGYRWKRR
ncbi:MAG: WD40 repeat domain-containing protein [Candidatus Hydrothermarchaeales archaeon]